MVGESFYENFVKILLDTWGPETGYLSILRQFQAATA